MIGERIHRARKAAGLSLRDLAEKTGISHTTLGHYEKEKRLPSSGILIELSQALGVRGEYFLRSSQVQVNGLEFRKNSNLRVRAQNRIRATVLEHIERWLELIDLCPAISIQEFSVPALLDEVGVVQSEHDIETLAQALRQSWHLGLNPIPDLVNVLEEKGILVIFVHEDDPQFSGLSAWANGIPVVVVGSQWPGDRQRFTLAHELAHIILAHRLDPALPVEKMCHVFAGAFLFPCPSVQQTFGLQRGHIELKELYLAKHTYGISMQTALIRAHQCKVITSRELQKVFQLLSKKGWRSQEPGDPVDQETTQRFEQLVLRGLAEGYFNESKAAELLNISISAFHRERNLEPAA
jgi:Zn-dependent peptidase ImmA (M78 family)/transcriptional regulator with XRE-family HTH domain